MRRRYTFLGLALLAGVLVTLALVKKPVRSQRLPTAQQQANLCQSNLLTTWWILRRAVWNDVVFPPSLNSIARETTNSYLFVCPATGHPAGAMTNVSDWTDFIYVGGVPEIQSSMVAILICPPENHSGMFGHVLWIGGGTSRLPPADIRLLIKEPWHWATNAPADQIKELKGAVTIQVPPALRAFYQSTPSGFKP